MPSIKNVALLGVLIASAGLAGCQTGRICEKDQAAIAKASDDWFTQAGAGEMEALADHYTEDAVVMPPGAEAIHGRKAIAAFFAQWPKIEKVEWKRQEIVGVGDLAYSQGTYSLLMRAPNAKKPIFDNGKYIEIWRRQADGSWKISRDIYNSSVALLAAR